MHIQQFIDIIKTVRVTLDNEKSVQEQVTKKFEGLSVSREFRLDAKNIPDLFFKETGLCVEIKIKGGKREIYSQLQRYSKFEQVKTILLLTNKSMGLPPHLNGKPVYIYNLSQAWL